MRITRQNFWIGSSIFITGLLFFIFTPVSMEVIGFESRFYLFALEMWRHGPNWFPTTYLQPYPDYPGLSTFFIYLTSNMMGNLTRFTAVFPSALVSAMTLTMTYLIGAHYHRKWGLSAVCFLLLCYTFVAEARTLSLDQYTTCITALCFYLAMRKKILWIFPCLLLGFAIRGPIGLVIPTSVLCIFYLLDRNIKSWFMICGVATVLIISCSAVLLLLAYQQGGESFVHEVIRMQVVGRLQEDKRLSMTYYFTDGMGAYALIYPIAVLVALGVMQVKSTDRIFLLKLIGWILIILLGMSIPTNKKIRYILPVAPALALLCGYLFVIGREYKYYHLLKKIVYSFCIVLPAICLSLITIIRFKHAEWVLPNGGLFTFFVITQIVILIIHVKSYHKDIMVLFLASMIFMSAYIFIVEPITLQLNRTHDFVQKVEQMRQQDNARLAFYQEGKDGVVIKYLANITKDEQPLFVSDATKLLINQLPIYFVSSQEHFSQIPSNIQRNIYVLSYGKIGRKQFIIFTNKPSSMK